jgi:hypothetical protein
MIEKKARIGAPSPSFIKIHFFFGAALGDSGGFADIIIIAGAGSGASAFLAESGSLSVPATNSASCHICVSFNMDLKLGIPVNRMPFSIFQ